MAIYAFSPTIATIINLAILLVALIIFRWISRRVRFYRTMLLDPVLSQILPSHRRPRSTELIVFPKNDLGPFQDKSRLRLTRDGDDGWLLQEANWWLPAKQFRLDVSSNPVVRCGWVMNSIEAGDALLIFSRRYDVETLRQLVEGLGMQMAAAEAVESSESLAQEFA